MEAMAGRAASSVRPAVFLVTGFLPHESRREHFRKAMRCLGTGVTIITVDQEGEVHGMTANAFCSVSLDPVLVLVCVDHRARTHAHLQARKRFGVNVLRSDQQAISEYYARSTESHQHAEEAGASFGADPTRHTWVGGRSRGSGVPIT